MIQYTTNNTNTAVVPIILNYTRTLHCCGGALPFHFWSRRYSIYLHSCSLSRVHTIWKQILGPRPEKENMNQDSPSKSSFEKNPSYSRSLHSRVDCPSVTFRTFPPLSGKSGSFGHPWTLFHSCLAPHLTILFFSDFPLLAIQNLNLKIEKFTFHSREQSCEPPPLQKHYFTRWQETQTRRWCSTSTDVPSLSWESKRSRFVKRV